MVDMLTELQALHVELARFRQSPPPPPFDDESWLPFGNSSQKGGVHFDRDRGRCFVILELWSCRLYLSASHCTFFLAHDVFMLMSSFLWVVYDRGRHYVLISVSCFTLCYIDYWFIFMRLFMIYILYFMLCEIKNLFCFTCIFHTCVYVFVKCYRNIQVDSVVLLFILATDRW